MWKLNLVREMKIVAKTVCVTVLTVVSLLALCNVLLGEDVIVLTSDKQLRGKILEENEDFVKFKGKYGVQEIDRDLIESIEYGFDFETEYKKRAGRLRKSNAKGWYKLGLWCKENKKPEKAEECFYKTVEADPNHAAARKKLGHRRWQGKWFESDLEYYRARDWVCYGNEWMPRADMLKYEAGLVKHEDGTWVSKKAWDKQEKKRRAERIKERQEREASGEEIDPAEDESGDPAAAIRRKLAGKGKLAARAEKNPAPADKKERKEWIKEYKARHGWTNHYETKHYVFMSTMPAGKTSYYAQLMEKMYRQYCRIFGYKQKQEKPFLVTVYGSQRQFMSREGKSQGVRGFYNGTRIVTWYRGAVHRTLFHEGTHQFQGLVWPDMADFELTTVPGGIWMCEGLATYFEASEVGDGGKLITGAVNKERLGKLRAAMARNTYMRISELICMTQAGYTTFHYAHGWGLTYFLIHSSSKLRNQFKKYFKAFKVAGVDPVSAFSEAFPYDQGTLDKRWRSYIMNIN